MRNIIFIAMTACAALLHSCARDVEIGDPLPVEPEYVFPQTGASQAVTDKIVTLYNDYGSYFLYDFTQKDFEWTLATGAGSMTNIDSAILGDPLHVGPLLDFLEQVWLDHIPERMKKGQGIPYRVFLVDEIKRRRAGTGYPPGMEYLYYNYKVSGKSLAFAGVNEAFGQMTAAEKMTRKNELVGVIFDYYANIGLIAFPDEFYTVSDYGPQPTTPVNAANPTNVEAFHQRGFLPSSYSGANVYYWLSNAYSWTNARTNDFNSFRAHLFQRTDEQMAPYLDNYPLIRQKFDLLVDHFMNEYGIDVRAIANSTF
jgi:hypothetical protein